MAPLQPDAREPCRFVHAGWRVCRGEELYVLKAWACCGAFQQFADLLYLMHADASTDDAGAEAEATWRPIPGHHKQR